jgi:hypothetical protein
MNAVMQFFLNCTDIKSLFLEEKFKICINKSNKFGYKGAVVNEFINLLKEKWLEDKKTLTPKKWKERIGTINESFSDSSQQDAHDYFNFLIDCLHEEINLKSEKEYIENPDSLKFDGNEEELALQFWSNNMKRNASFIYSLFLGQLRSQLTCQKCNTTKINFETFSSVSLPVPQSSKIQIEVVLFRLPFTFKVYYNTKSISNPQGDIRSHLKLLRTQSLEISIDAGEYAGDTSIVGRSTSLTKKEILNTLYYEKANRSKTQDKVFMSSLTTNIPVRLVIKIDRKEKVSKILSKLRHIVDLELESESKYTKLLVYNKHNFIDLNLKIDDCFQNNQAIYVYEVLNTMGTNKLFKYGRDSSEPLHPLNNFIMESFWKTIHINNDKETIEFLVQISHRFPTQTPMYFMNPVGYTKLETFFNVIIVNNRVSRCINFIEAY